MGCNGSRLNAQREAIPAKLGPMLRRRIEEIKRRRHSRGGKDTTPSGAELLLNHDDKAKDYDHDDIENSMVSCVTSEDSKGSTAKRAEAGDPQIVESAKEKEKNKGGKEEKTAMVNVEAESKNNAKEEDESRDNKDDEGMHDNENSIMFPGSPSFRIYFADNLDEDDDGDFDGGGKKENCADEKTRMDHGMPPKKNLQDSEPKKPKEGRKRRSFRKVMPKAGQTAMIPMKNLFNVKSCYTPSCSSHDRAHLLAEKTPA